MQEIIDRFQVLAPEGTVYGALIKQNRIRSSSMDDRVHEYIDGMKEVCLTDGRRMNRIDDSTFEIVATGEIVKRVV